jgi:hypothetical protein
MQATTVHMYASGHAPSYPGQEAGQTASSSNPPHVNHCGIRILLGLPQGTNISPSAWFLLIMHDTILQNLSATTPFSLHVHQNYTMSIQNRDSKSESGSKEVQ